MELLGELRGVFSFRVSLRSTKECREEKQKLCAEVEGKAKSSEQVSRELR